MGKNLLVSRTKQSISALGFADRTGLEPATSSVTGMRSNQLIYDSTQ